MGIKFDGTDDYVDFGVPAEIAAMGNQITILADFMNLLSTDRFALWNTFYFNTASASDCFGIGLYTNASGLLTLAIGGTTSYGSWSYNTPLSTSQFYRVGATFDISNISNDPILYVDGLPVTVTESVTPAGTYRPAFATATVYLGRLGIPSAWDYANGKLFRSLVYSEIFTAAEMLEDFYTKYPVHTIDSLQFCAGLWQPMGGILEAGTLSSSNKIPNLIGSSVGTPTNSPTFLHDPYLTYED